MISSDIGENKVEKVECKILCTIVQAKVIKKKKVTRLAGKHQGINSG